MKRGTLVLVPFPFTDLSGQKLRPALVVSRSDRPGSDVVVAFITSYRDDSLSPTDLLITTDRADFKLTGLKASSVIKLDKLVTIDSSIMLGELGLLSPALLEQANEKLRYALDV